MRANEGSKGLGLIARIAKASCRSGQEGEEKSLRSNVVTLDLSYVYAGRKRNKKREHNGCDEQEKSITRWCWC